MTEDMNQVNLSDYDVKPLKVGEIVKGTVKKIEEKQVIVEVNNYDLQFIVPISELANYHIDTPSDLVTEGEDYPFLIKKIEDEMVVLSKKEVDFESAWAELEELQSNGTVFEAKVSEAVKGGLIVNKGIRCFVPASMIDTKFVEDLSIYQDQVLSFKVVELDKEKKKAILSHKIVLQELKAKQQLKAMNDIKVGQIVKGDVVRLTNFGAFVSIGEVEGLVHISQISHARIKHPSEALTEGQAVSVKVLSIDPETKKIALSIKDTEKSPWEQHAEELVEGAVLEGTVKRLTNFGAFVEVFPGVEGLVHVSQLSHEHVKSPHEVVQVGEIMKVKVREVRHDEQKLALSRKELIENPDAEITDFEMPEEHFGGFQLGELFADKLKGFIK